MLSALRPRRAHNQRAALRVPRAVCAIALAALLFPASALAHTGTATVACDAADFRFTQFAAGANTVNYKVTVDSATAVQGTFALDANGGREGALHVPLALHGTHTVAAFAWWGPGGIADGNTRPADSPALASQTLQCPPAPTPPPPAAPGPPAPPAPPVPALPTAPVSAPTPTPPANRVQGTRARTGTARIAIRRACALRRARVTISGRSLRRITLFVNGHRVRSVVVRPGRRSITVAVPLPRSGPARRRLIARVSFRNGARPRTLTARATRCAQAPVVPQFTG